MRKAQKVQGPMTDKDQRVGYLAALFGQVHVKLSLVLDTPLHQKRVFLVIWCQKMTMVTCPA